MRIVTDVQRLAVLCGQEPPSRIRAAPTARQTAVTLYAHAEQLASRSGDPELLSLVARTPRPATS
ncbi:hypothetical protein ABZ383_31725 [Streptomyces sp. NPDC005900]|uniref:hypothetical protein n=1 Tax=Streptomyces sp. NPDC005900 TaxID=3154569 RepID=UPI0033DB6F99